MATLDTLTAEQYAALVARRGHRRKFGNELCEADGYRFASRKERDRYHVLKLEQLARHISDLMVHPSWDLHADGGAYVARYTADFSYRAASGALVVEDVKSDATRKETAYRMRKRWLLAEYGIALVEV